MFKSIELPKLNDQIKNLHHFFEDNMESFLGYPCNGKFDYRPLYPFLDYPLNNVGDPFVSSNFTLNTHAIEREVINIFQNLAGADPKETWGYCIPCHHWHSWDDWSTAKSNRHRNRRKL